MGRNGGGEQSTAVPDFEGEEEEEDEEEEAEIEDEDENEKDEEEEEDEEEMNLLVPSGQRDTASGADGDSGFVGVEERYAPQLVKPGYVCGARNKRFRNGRCASRLGIALLPWMQGNGRTPFTEVYGGFVFNDPNDLKQWILIAADGGVWRTRPNSVCQAVPLPAGTVLTRGTFRKFVQANSAVVMLRGLEEEPLACSNLEAGFHKIAQRNVFDCTLDWGTKRVGLPAHHLVVGDAPRFQGNPDLPKGIIATVTYYVRQVPNGDEFTISRVAGEAELDWGVNAGDNRVTAGKLEIRDGAVPIPPATAGLFVGNRLVLVSGKDTVVASDIGDYTRYAPVAASFRINEGDAYTLQEVCVFNEDTLLFFKDGAVLKVTGVTGDLSSAQGPLNVTEAYGAVGAGAVAAHGADVYWLSSELRIATLRLTALNQEQGTDSALSDPLVQTFGRMNGTYASGARLAVYDGYLLCALPLDEAQLVSGTEVVPGGQQYSPIDGTHALAGLTAGQRYRYRQGGNGGTLVNGTETLRGDCDFTAQGAGATLTQEATLPLDGRGVTESVVAIRAEGVNTGVAVYDFLNQAWAGTDEGPTGTGSVTCVVDWLKFEQGGRPRLGFLGADGWLHLYDEGYEDEALLALAAPYVDVLVDRLALLTDGDSLQVNGGDVVAANPENDTAHNVGTVWGAGPSVARTNLWADGNGRGYASGLWSAPNTVASVIDYGVRFTATNGVLPVVKVNGAVVADGASDWAFVDSHSGSEIAGVPIADYVRSRGYLCERPFTPTVRGKSLRYVALGVQVATWGPKYTIRARVQGQGSGVEYVTGETRDRLKYFAPHDAPDWDATNSGDDYGGPRREDYSWAATDAGILLGSGIDFDAVQEYGHRVPVSERGLWMQLEIENAEGRLELLGVMMEGVEGEMLSGPVIA